MTLWMIQDLPQCIISSLTIHGTMYVRPLKRCRQLYHPFLEQATFIIQRFNLYSMHWALDVKLDGGAIETGFVSKEV